MELITEKVGDVTVVILPEMDLDARNVNEFKRDVAALLNTTKKAVFDMSQVRFVDSSGVGAIFSCLRTLNAAGGDLKLCCPTNAVRIFFSLIRLSLVLGIFDTQEEAVRAFAAR